jgi:DNA replication protein DnaC
MNSAMTHLSLEANLKALRLPTFLKEYEDVAKESVRKNASYEDFLRDLSEKELINKQSNAIQKRIKQAQFPVLKTLEAFDFKAAPKLNKKLVLDLAQGDFLERHDNIIALGNSGTGKTHIATSLGLRACQLGKSVFFTQASHLVHQLLEAQEERHLLKLKKKLLSYDLLIIDELGFVPFSKTGAELLFEIFSNRYEKGSIAITSNLPFEEWPQIFGCERLTGALLDRLTHHVHILEMNGESFRLASSKKKNQGTAKIAQGENEREK